MKLARYTIILVFLLSIVRMSANNLQISGYVFDKSSGEPLAGATIKVLPEGPGTFSNSYGYFYMVVNTATSTVRLQVTYVGYDTVMLELPASSGNNNLKIYLTPGINIQSVEVVSQVPSSGFSYRITQNQIKLLPSLTSDYDVLKAFQVLPGIQFGVEGTSDLYIMGGSPDQNRLLIDGIPIIYYKHFGGFVSIFDIEAIRDAKLVRSGFNPQYGGKLSGYVDILLKQGDPQKRHSVLDVGLLSSKFSSNGYLIKNKLTYLLSVRGTNYDWLTQAAQLINPGGYFVGFNFYDLTVKLNYKINFANQLELFFYNGQDRFYLRINDTRPLDEQPAIPGFPTYEPLTYNSGRNLYKWGNTASGIKWIFNKNKYFSTLTFGFSSFGYKSISENEAWFVRDPQPDSLMSSDNSLKSGSVSEAFAKYDATYQMGKAKINFGLFNTLYSSVPYYGTVTHIDTIVHTMYYDKIQLRQNVAGLYSGFSVPVNNKLKMNIGFRTSILDRKFYFSPRAVVDYRVTPSFAVSLAASRVYQFMHLLRSSVYWVPNDAWVTSTDSALPESSNLADIKFRYKKNNLTFSAGAFYKTFDNLIDYKRVLLGSERTVWDRIVYNGTGYAYGAYGMLKFTTLKNTFWLNYTYNKNFRLFKELNNGKPYPEYFTRDHNLNVIFIRKMSDHWSFSSTFFFNSGMYVTLQTSNQNIAEIGNPGITDSLSYAGVFFRLNFDGFLPVSYEINNYKLPPYHRLDLALRYTNRFKRSGRKYTFALNIINVYCRLNPLMIFSSTDDWGNYHLYKLSILPVIPTFSFEINFDR